ncbi:MAG: hypothetical protein ACYC1U_07615 [Candidatus Aquicultorales bacterium]
MTEMRDLYTAGHGRISRGIERALEEISENKGLLYDAKAVEACLRIFESEYRFS